MASLSQFKEARARCTTLCMAKQCAHGPCGCMSQWFQMHCLPTPYMQNRQTRVLSSNQFEILPMLQLHVTDSGKVSTLGRLTFDGQAGQTFTAHPKVDPDSGEMFFCGSVTKCGTQYDFVNLSSGALAGLHSPTLLPLTSLTNYLKCTTLVAAPWSPRFAVVSCRVRPGSSTVRPGVSLQRDMFKSLHCIFVITKSKK